jgi:hypothetical protein
VAALRPGPPRRKITNYGWSTSRSQLLTPTRNLRRSSPARLRRIGLPPMGTREGASRAGRQAAAELCDPISSGEPCQVGAGGGIGPSARAACGLVLTGSLLGTLFRISWAFLSTAPVMTCWAMPNRNA